MNTEEYEKEYDYVTFLTNHDNLFKYDSKANVWYENNNEMIIGNKRSLSEVIKSVSKNILTDNEKENLLSSLNRFPYASLIAIDSHNGAGIIIEPIKNAFEKYGYNDILRQEQKDDKFIAGTIESVYDNYLSVEEEVDEKEKEIIDY